MNRFLILLILLPCTLQAKRFSIKSPDKTIQLTLELTNGHLSYKLTKDNRLLIDHSGLGINTTKADFKTFKYVKHSTQSENKTWQPVWEQFNEINNHYNQLSIHLSDRSDKKNQMCFRVRVFNDGIGFRYELLNANRKTVKITNETTEYAFTAPVAGYSPNGESIPIGPNLRSIERLKTPFVMDNHLGYAIAIHEADLVNYSYMNLHKKASNRLAIGISPSTVSIPFKTPWRTIQVTKDLGQLVTSSLILNLNPPCNRSNFSWVKSGMATNECRLWGAKLENGFRYGKNQETFKRLIEFAQSNRLEYIMVDSGWYGNQWDKESDPLTPRQMNDSKTAASFYHGDAKEIDKLRGIIDMPALIDYGKAHSVGVIIYTNDLLRRNHGMAYLEKVFATYQKWGAKGIKYGFMREKDPQKKVQITRSIIQLCAKYHLLVNFHDGPVHPTGERRTYPNIITREFGHAQFDGAKTFTASGFLRTIFVNGVAGPIDYMNGFFDIESNAVKDRFQVREQLQSTVVAEAARTLIGSYGLTVLSDHDAAYNKKADLFQFIKACKGNWDETIVLEAQMGRLATFARREDNKWYIASHVSEAGAHITIPLHFLSDGKHHATIFTDGNRTSFIRNREKYKAKKQTVTPQTELQFKVPPGGGVCIIID
ncbi:hypothetical protein EMN47_11670 [Prolixibacteraceae bacterium JC049]|nr:hypothetical protein [Prolixibacteraceae bacterium JC049]